MRSSYKYIILILFVLMPGLLYSQSQDWVRKSIYPQADSGKSKIYNWMWGRHYRHLYTIPIRVPSATIETLGGGMDIVGQAEGFHGLLLENKRKQLYLLKPLGGSTSFLESKFFREIYNKADFKNTYLDEFLGDAYTIINPYTFLVADYLAKSAGLSFSPSSIYYIPSHMRKDTVADGSDIQDRLVNLINVPDINLRSNLSIPGIVVVQKAENLLMSHLKYKQVAIVSMLIITLGLNFIVIDTIKNNIRQYRQIPQNNNVYQEVGEYIKANTDPTDTIYSHRMWGIMYLTADRLSATNYFALAAVNVDEFTEMSDGLFEDLESNKPAYIVTQDGRISGEETDSRLQEYITDHYVLEKEFDLGIHLYKWVCIGFGAASSSLLVWQTFALNARYGEHGLMKLGAARSHPRYLINRRRITRLFKRQRKEETT